ncbi:MAG: hypothetical protein IKL65_02665 [Bacilli bacterium]|nr:hypothetical protein [Bacilli bacterium]
MEKIVEFIMLNYTWIVAGLIIILLAIIGSYADKTNFGQGKPKEEIKKEDTKIEKEELQTINEVIENQAEVPIKEKTIDQNQIPEPQETFTQENNIETNSEPSLDSSFEKFDKEFNELLPKKEIIDDELLEEIDSLSLDKTQKLNLTDIPDLDDVELPKIKSMEPEEEDIWKF